MHGTWGDIDEPRIHRYDELPRDRPRFLMPGERSEARFVTQSGETAGRGVCYNASLNWEAKPRVLPRPETVAGRTAERLQREAAAVSAALRHVKEDPGLPRPSWREPRTPDYGEYLGQPAPGDILSGEEWSACIDAVKEIEFPEPPRPWQTDLSGTNVVQYDGSWAIGRPVKKKSHAEMCREQEEAELAAKHDEERFAMELRELRFKKRRAVEVEEYMLAAELQREIKEIEETLQARETLRKRVVEARLLRDSDDAVPQEIQFNRGQEDYQVPPEAQGFRLKQELKEAEEVIALARLHIAKSRMSLDAAGPRTKPIDCK